MIGAYDKNILEKSQRNLGSFIECGVNRFNMALKGLWNLFLSNERSILFSKGDYSVITAISGVELTFDITGFSNENSIIVNKDSAEYWLGSFLAYAQWKMNVSFQLIEKYVPIDELLSLYHPFHELPIDKFVSFLIQAIKVRKGKSNLEIFRRKAKLSRSELSKKSHVPLRMIEHYEQGIKNINKANAKYIISLADALYVKPEELLEIEII